MNIFKKAKYIVTKNDDLLAEQTDNGIQPFDPQIEVSQVNKPLKKGK